MTNVAILTLSFLPDIEGFKRLHDSILRFGDAGTVHHVVVPKRDLKVFQALESPMLRVWSENDFLPSGFVATGGLSAMSRRLTLVPRSLNCSALNLHHPWPPLRGWILQQILKLSAATKLDADAVVIIDSDVVLIQNFKTSMFADDAAVRLYEHPGAVHPGLARHRHWTRVAHELLGLPWDDQCDFPDYVGGIVSWDPKLVSGCLGRIEEVTGIRWATALSKELHFSEFILYGTYVLHFGTAEQRSFISSRTLCHSYWAPVPMDKAAATNFIDSFDGLDIAVHIQSNSRTPREVVDDVVLALTNRVSS